MKKSVILLLILAASATARAQLPPGSELKRYTPNALETHLQTRYYKADGNFTKSGNSYDSLPSGYGFDNFQFDLGGRWAVSPRTAFFGAGSLGYSRAQSPLRSDRTNSSFSEMLVGGDFLLTDTSSLQLIPEATLVFPFSKNDYNSDSVAVSDGAIAASGRLIALGSFGAFRVGAFGGFTYRTEGLSSLLPYGVLAELSGSSLAWGVDLRGFTTLGQDKDNNNEFNRDTYLCRANGCAKRYAAINPGVLEANTWLKIMTSRNLDFTAGAGFALTGQSYSRGYSANLGMTYRWDLAPSTSSYSYPAPRQKAPQQPTFQEEVDDGVDQNLFRQAPPPKPAPTPDPNLQRKKRQQQMQEDLDKTEMQIELKSSKKKRR